jgi:hypothetical protein
MLWCDANGRQSGMCRVVNNAVALCHGEHQDNSGMLAGTFPLKKPTAASLQQPQGFDMR